MGLVASGAGGQRETGPCSAGPGRSRAEPEEHFLKRTLFAAAAIAVAAVTTQVAGAAGTGIIHVPTTSSRRCPTPGPRATTRCVGTGLRV